MFIVFLGHLLRCSMVVQVVQVDTEWISCLLRCSMVVLCRLTLSELATYWGVPWLCRLTLSELATYWGVPWLCRLTLSELATYWDVPWLCRLTLSELAAYWDVPWLCRLTLSELAAYWDVPWLCRSMLKTRTRLMPSAPLWEILTSRPSMEREHSKAPFHTLSLLPFYIFFNLFHFGDQAVLSSRCSVLSHFGVSLSNYQ